MRQLFTWRFLAALGALALLFFGVDRALASANKDGAIAFVAPANLDENGEIISRRIDLIEPVARVEPSPDFEVGSDGRTVGVLDLVIDENRVARVAPETPGDVNCEEWSEPDRCVLIADVLGDAVVWFTLQPRAARDTVRLGPIVDLQDGYAQFENGWEILYESVIEREEDSCDQYDIPSFSDFLRRFGPNSRTVVDLETKKVSAVICRDEYVPPPTTVVFEGSLSGSIVMPTTSVATVDPDIEAPDS